MKRFSVFLFLPFALCLLPSASYSTVLGDLAASTQPGTWKELTGTNLTANLLYSTSGGNQNILEYTDDAQWDPVTEQFLFVGTGHYATWHFVAYTAGTNSWREITGLPWGGVGHAYDHSAIDPQARLFYHRPYGSTTVHKYNIDTKSWGTLPAIPNNIMEYNNCCVGFDYFPEMHSLLYFSLESGNNGSLIRFNNSTNQWVRVGTGKNLPTGNYQHFTEYNPVHKVFWFGGGGSSTANYMADSLGNITALSAAPVPLGVMNTIITVDPVSGDYLVFTKDSEFYTFNISTKTWKKQPGTAPFFTPANSGGPIWCTVAAPVNTYGVNMFLKYLYGTPSLTWIYVYKHSAGTGLSPVSLSRNRGPGLDVFPNPALPGAPLRLTVKGKELRGAQLYGLDGRLLMRENLSAPAAAGTYLVRARASGAVLSKRLAVLR